jgi:putative transposase
MCCLLRVFPRGFYAWLKSPLSRRANEDKWQTDLLLKAWGESGKVYGYRKRHDDHIDQGEMCCPNRVARLTRLAGIKAEIGYKRRPGIMVARLPSLSTTHSTGNSMSLFRTRPGLRTSPTSEPARASPVLRSSSISFPAALSAGRCRADKPPM